VKRTPGGSLPGSGISGLNSCAAADTQYNDPGAIVPNNDTPPAISSRRFNMAARPYGSHCQPFQAKHTGATAANVEAVRGIINGTG
jgi:hypothetical protein